MMQLRFLVTLLQFAWTAAWTSRMTNDERWRASAASIESPLHVSIQDQQGMIPSQESQGIIPSQESFFRSAEEFQQEQKQHQQHQHSPPSSYQPHELPKQSSQPHHHTHHHPSHGHERDNTNHIQDDSILASSASSFFNKACGTARRNFSRTARFTQRDLDSPFGEGTFRYVAMGEYVAGPRAGHPCVGKYFQDGSIYEESYYDNDMKVTEKAIQLVALWNQEGLILDMVHVNHPEVWTFHKNAVEHWRDTKLLIEPYITNFRKFNSNSGWYDSTFDWGQAMQALSHFTYHISGGKLLLCDLQGGVTENGLILTDPAIVSTETGQYGPTDLGPSGIDLFFRHHVCNEFCQHHWITPDRTADALLYRRRQGTTMVRMDTQPPQPPRTPPPPQIADRQYPSPQQQQTRSTYHERRWYETAEDED